MCKKERGTMEKDLWSRITVVTNRKLSVRPFLEQIEILCKKRPERIGSLLVGGGKKHGSRGHDAQRGRVFPETGKKCAESVSGMIQQSGDRRIEERADEHQDQKEAECRQKTGAFFT